MVEITQLTTTIRLFLAAALTEIGGDYLVWLWIKSHKGIAIGLVGAVLLFLYGIIPTLQPANFGRVYSAYGGFFIAVSIVWGLIIDKKKPDRYEIIGSTIAVCSSNNILRSKMTCDVVTLFVVS